MNPQFVSFDNEISTETPIATGNTYNECVQNSILGEFSDSEKENILNTPNFEQILGFSVKRMYDI